MRVRYEYRLTEATTVILMLAAGCDDAREAVRGVSGGSDVADDRNDPARLDCGSGASSPGEVAGCGQRDIDSVPHGHDGQLKPLASPPKVVPAVSVTPSSLVDIGLNFHASQLNIDSTFIPPDTMGAVGPDHIVELINGRYDVYDKTTGTEVRTQTLDGFWTNVVGLTIPAGRFTFDPRIVFDTATNRWIAVSIDGGDGNNIYLGRTDGDDPTGAWQGVRFAADTVGAAEFHDYPTLAVDADGVYICTQDFNGGGNESCYSIPKADVLAGPPTLANLTRFEATPAGLPAVNGSIQPALDFGASDGRAALFGSTGTALIRSDILGAAAANATLGTPTAITGDPGHAAAPPARQPHPAGRTIENVTPRFVGNVFELGDSLWAVHAVRGNSNNSALRWYEISETTNTVLQTGLIEDPNEDYHEPTIAVNSFGHVVLGFTCSGPSLSPAACVAVGTTTAGTTTFDTPFVVQAGAGHYWRDFVSPPNAERNRWGDYSATVIDPEDACTFWTFQEYVAVSAVGDVGPSVCSNNANQQCLVNADCGSSATCNALPEGGEWGVQITELRFTADECNRPPECDANGPYQAECGGATTTIQLDATGSSDPDGDALEYAWTTSCPGGTFDDPTSATPKLTVDSAPGCNIDCAVSVTVSDEHEASSKCGSTVSIRDTLDPEITCPNDKTVECDRPTDPSATGSATAVDICDEDPLVASSDVVTPGACPQESTITRTWTATDDCANTDDCAQTIEVVDTTAPVPSCNAPATIKPPDVPISFTATASDNCDGGPSVVVSDRDCFKIAKNGKIVSKLESCEVTLMGSTVTIVDSGGVDTHITWNATATDACGNSQTASCEVVVVNPGKKP